MFLNVSFSPVPVQSRPPPPPLNKKMKNAKQHGENYPTNMGKISNKYRKKYKRIPQVPQQTPL